MSSISLVSLNIERSKHLDRVLPFLKERHPDVLCLQELVDGDRRLFAEQLGFTAELYVPMTRETDFDGSIAVHGLGIFSRLPFSNTSVHYYAGDASHLPETRSDDPETFPLQNRCVLHGEVTKGSATFRIATTHFVWSYGGEATDLQRSDMQKLLHLLEGEELVLCGDFNAPRGGEIFSMLAAEYKDNIPPRYETSIDVSLHRAGKTRAHALSTKMVDGLFTTPAYRASNVELIPGVSDHFAIVAEITGAS